MRVKKSRLRLRKPPREFMRNLAWMMIDEEIKAGLKLLTGHRCTVVATQYGDYTWVGLNRIERLPRNEREAQWFRVKRAAAATRLRMRSRLLFRPWFNRLAKSIKSTVKAFSRFAVACERNAEQLRKSSAVFNETIEPYRFYARQLARQPIVPTMPLLIGPIA